MKDLFTKGSRQVVPRWRPALRTALLGELRGLERNPKRLSPHWEGLVRERSHDWSERNSPVHAAELIGTALATGLHHPAIEAAKQVLATSGRGSSPRLMAQRLLEAEGLFTQSPDVELASSEETHRQIAALRRRLKTYPRSAYDWLDLALLYATVGELRAAFASARRAVGILPGDRHVLRSVARLMLHGSGADEALDLLADSPATRADPWLVSAEVAMAELAGRTAPHVRQGAALLGSDNFSAFDKSELAAALGTLEASSGAHRNGRRLFAVALSAPTENVVAQAQWLDGRTLTLDLEERHLDIASSSEAGATAALRRGEYQVAYAQALRWLADQPFSRDPAVLATYTASVGLEDYDSAIGVARMGLLANPHDWLLRNNLVFSLASSGRLADATVEFARLTSQIQKTSLGHPTLKATAGLLAFRAGQLDEARRLYARAIEEFEGADLHESAALASTYLAREELLTGSHEARGAVERAAELMRPYFSPEVVTALDRVKRQLKKPNSSQTS